MIALLSSRLVSVREFVAVESAPLVVRMSPLGFLWSDIMVWITCATAYVHAIARRRVPRNATATRGKNTVLGITKGGVVADGAATQSQNAMSTVVIGGVADNGAALTGTNS